MGLSITGILFAGVDFAVLGFSLELVICMFTKFEKFGPVGTVGISLDLWLRVILTGILLLRLGTGARL